MSSRLISSGMLRRRLYYEYTIKYFCSERAGGYPSRKRNNASTTTEGKRAYHDNYLRKGINVGQRHLNNCCYLDPCMGVLVAGVCSSQHGSHAVLSKINAPVRGRESIKKIHSSGLCAIMFLAHLLSEFTKTMVGGSVTFGCFFLSAAQNPSAM